MSVNRIIYIVGVVLFLLSLSSCEDDYIEPAPQTVVNYNNFWADAEGWLIEGDAVESEAQYSDTSGLNNTGYIFAQDYTTGGIWYFVAPSGYHGDKSECFNGYIEFFLIQESAMADQFYYEDVIIDGGVNGKLIAYFDDYPGLTWTNYKILLNERGYWFNESNDMATDSEIQDVLSSIKKISIRGEFEVGPDTGGLDDFSMHKGL